MATIISVPSSSLFYKTCAHFRTYPSSSVHFLNPRPNRTAPISLCKKNKNARCKAAAVEAVGEVEEEGEESVSVPVSPSDMLTMFFKAEGMMDDSTVTNVSKALEDIEGVTDLKVQISEGIASVELTKQTTVQATGVASNLVEIIQGSGFRLQTLTLSFEDEEDAV